MVTVEYFLRKNIEKINKMLIKQWNGISWSTKVYKYLFISQKWPYDH